MGIPSEVSPAPQITETSTIVSKDDKSDQNQEQDEREEGEIVDDFEDIISSDEEVSMKKRIEELEERNLELEKIAKISVVYNYDYNKERYDIANLPVSDISDNDDLYLSPIPAKGKRRSKKSVADTKIYSGEKMHHRRLRKREISPDSSLLSALHSRTKGKKKKNQKLSKSKSRKKTERVKKKIYLDDASSDEEFCALNRDKLRLALKRDVAVSCKPMNEINVVDTKEVIDDEVQVIEEVVEVVEVESDKDEEIKSKSDKEANKNDSDDSVTLEEQELRLIALKSAIMKKAFKRKKRKESEGKKPYSPSEFVELKGGFNSSPRDSMESGPMDISPIASPDLSDIELCNKPIDMELVSSNSSSPVLIGHAGTWVPINNIPANNKQSSVVIHTPKAVKLVSLPNGDGTPQKQTARENECEDHTKLYIRSSSPDPSDEEELALRTLLLAKMKSPKAGKKTKTDGSIIEQKKEFEENRPRSVSNNSSDNGLDPEALKIVLELSMKESFNNKTELVLKEAVRRLKNQTTCGSPDMQVGEDSCRKSVHMYSGNSNSRTPVPMASEEVGAMRPIVLNEEVKENMQQEILMNAVPVDQRISVTDNVPEYTQNILESLRDAGRVGTVFQPAVPNRLERKDKFYIHSNQNSVAVNRNVLKVVPVTTLGELQTPNSALVPIPLKPTIVDTSTTVKAVHIPKMKTKVVRTRTKVVNKINTIAQLKRKLSAKQDEISSAKKKLKMDASFSDRTDITKSTSSRLITKLDIPKVQKMIIHLGQSESDSDDLTTELAATVPANEKDYFDNASPMSLQMDSPCYSPTPKSPACADANAASENTKDGESELAGANTSTKSIVNDVFEARLDEFLKNARTKVEQNKICHTPCTPKSSLVLTTPTEESARSLVTQTTVTPLAVRHLPPSSQLEYRRLVNRMKLLEKQKQARSNKVVNKNIEAIKVVIRNKQAGEDQQQLRETSSIVVTTTPTPTVLFGFAKAMPPVVIQKTVLNEVAAAARNENSTKNSLIKKVLTKAVATKAAIMNKASLIKDPQVSETKIAVVSTENENSTVPTINKPPVVQGPQINEDKKAASLEKEKSANAAPVRDVTMNNEALKIVSESTIKSATNPLESYEIEFKENSSRLCEKISKAMELVKEASDERLKQLLLQSKLEAVKKEMLKLEGELDAQKKILSKILPEISEHHKNITALKAKCLKIEKSAKAASTKDSIDGEFKFEGNSVDVQDKYKQFALAIKKLKNMRISELHKKQTTISEDSCSYITETKNSEPTEVLEKNNVFEFEGSSENKNKETQPDVSQSDNIDPFKEQVEEIPKDTDSVIVGEEHDQRKTENIEDISENISIPVNTGISEDISSIYTTEQQIQFCDIAMETNLEMRECAIGVTEEMEQDNASEQISDKIHLSTKEDTVSTATPSYNDPVNSDLCSLIASNASFILEKLSEGFFSLEEIEESERDHQVDIITNEGAKTEEVTEPEAADSTNSVRMEGVLMDELKSEDESATTPPSKFKIYASPLEHMSEENHFNPNGIICPFQLMGECSDEHCKYEHLGSDSR